MKHIFVYDHSELIDGSYHLYALSSNHQSVCLTVTGFSPHIYVELTSEHVDLMYEDSDDDDSDEGGCEIMSIVNKAAKSLKIKINVVIEMKKKLFYNHKVLCPIDQTLKETLFPYLKISFKSSMHMHMLCKRIRTLHADTTIKIQND